MMVAGLALYSVRDLFLENPARAVQKVSETGFCHVESYNHCADEDIRFFGIPANELNAMTDGRLHIASGHFTARSDTSALLRNTKQMSKMIDYHEKIGCKYLVLSAEFFTSEQHLLASCKRYNEIGRECAQHGMMFLYHNHYWDFQKIGGRTIMEAIVEETDPMLLNIQLDCYWIYRGMMDPVAYLKKYGNRVKSLHQKDFPQNKLSDRDLWKRLDRNVLVTNETAGTATEADEYIEVGEGVMPLQDIIDAGNQWGAEYVFVEQDFTALSQTESMKRSFDHYKKMQGLIFEKSTQQS